MGIRGKPCELFGSFLLVATVLQFTHLKFLQSPILGVFSHRHKCHLHENVHEKSHILCPKKSL